MDNEKIKNALLNFFYMENEKMKNTLIEIIKFIKSGSYYKDEELEDDKFDFNGTEDELENSEIIAMAREGLGEKVKWRDKQKEFIARDKVKWLERRIEILERDNAELIEKQKEFFEKI